MARVLLFGRLADQAGWRDRTIAAGDLASLRNILAAELGDALTGPGVQVAVDKVLVRGGAALSEASEVAFLPPMSGG
jgi:molybdopterin synthase sulfur carrier subunit